MSEKVKVAAKKKQILAENVDRLNEDSSNENDTGNAFDVSFNVAQENVSFSKTVHDKSNSQEDNSKTLSGSTPKHDTTAQEIQEDSILTPNAKDDANLANQKPKLKHLFDHNDPRHK